MNVLAIDGALGVFSVACAADDAILAVRARAGNVALEIGLAMVGDVLAETGLTSGRIDRVAVGIGPGGFTGLRIAIAYAKSLAQAWARPLVAISSFDALEFGRAFDAVLTIVAGRPGVISARYRAGAQVRRASGRIAEALAAVISADASPVSVVGASKDVLAALAEGGIIVQSFEPLVTPPAAAIALAAGWRDPATSVHQVRADYGEVPAAKVPKG